MSGTENDFLASMCPKWIPDTNGTRMALVLEHRRLADPHPATDHEHQGRELAWPEAVGNPEIGTIRDRERQERERYHKEHRKVADAFPNAKAYVGESFNDACRKMGRKQAQTVSSACNRKVSTC